MLKQLWKQYNCEGNERAFTALFTLLSSDLYAYGTGLGYKHDDVNDAIQEVFINLHCNKNLTIQAETLKFYLLRSVKNKLIDMERVKKITSPWEEHAHEFDLQLSIEEDYIHRENMDHIRRQVSSVLDQLTPHQKEIVYLRYIEGLEYDQIAELLNMNVQTVRGQVFKSMQKLRKLNPAGQALFFMLLGSLPG
ncbi:MAG: RNA polymerase sigma factor [Bacteroidales bacterium]